MARIIEADRPLGSFEQWAEWCRDPLLALGCRDPVERIDAVKSDDPHRRQIVELFDAWHVHHGERPVKASALPEVDPKDGGPQHIAARLVQLTGTRAGAFVLTRQEPAGKWGVATYSFVRTGGAIYVRAVPWTRCFERQSSHASTGRSAWGRLQRRTE